jgi:integrase
MASSRAYIDSMHGYLVNHILPYFGNKRLQMINSRMVEDWLMALRKKKGRASYPLSPTTVNQCLTCLKIMLNEAVRLEYLLKNPAAGIGKLKEHKQSRSIFTLEEVRTLFCDDTVDSVWGGDKRHFTLNLLAASTGMRLGECLALQLQHVHEQYVTITQNWDRKYGFKEPKWGSARQIPIPERTSHELQNLICISPYQKPWNFVFTDNGSVPFNHSTALRNLY